MKRIVMFALLALMFALSSRAGDAPKRQGWSGPALHGDVTSVVVTELADDGSEKVSKYKFNKKGDVSEVYVRNNNGAFDPSMKYSYNEAGQKVYEVYYRANGTSGKQVYYLYNTAGKRLREAEYNMSGKLLSRVFYTYKEGRVVEMIVHDFVDNNKNSYPYEYNSTGRLTVEMECSYHLDGVGSIIYNGYKYDSNGNKISLESYICNDMEGFPTNISYQHDDKGRVVEETMVVAPYDFYQKKSVYKYDDQGKLIEEKIVEEGRLVEGTKNTLRRYKYDSLGNEIEVVEYRNGDEWSGRTAKSTLITYRN